MIVGVLLGHCSYFTYANCTKWENKCEKCQEKDNYPKSLIDNSKKNYELKKQLFTEIKKLTIVTPSEWLANLVKKSFLKEYEIKVINNGIDLNVFKSAYDENIYEKYNIPRNKKIILGVASVWEKRKGLDDFIKLSNIIDENYTIVLVGISKEQQKKLPEKIVAIKRTENMEELANIYSQANVFVNPTYEDNFPTTNLEAMACGTPVITYNTGGCKEAVNNKTGVVIKVGDIDSIKKNLEKIDNMDKIDCIERAKEYEDFEKYKHYIRLYNEI